MISRCKKEEERKGHVDLIEPIDEYEPYERQLDSEFQVAIRDGNAELCKILLFFGTDVNERDKAGFTPLMRSTLWSHTKECFECILKDENVDVHAVNKQGYTVFHYVAEVGNEKMCADLLERGADVNAQNFNGTTPLMLAVIYANNKSLAFILKHEKVKVNAFDGDGNTALHYAVMYRNTNASRALLAKSSNVNAKNQYDETPLMKAITFNNNECAKMMLRKGVKLEIKNRKDQTVLDIAQERENYNMVEILKNVEILKITVVRGYVAGSLKRLGERNALVFGNIII